MLRRHNPAKGPSVQPGFGRLQRATKRTATRPGRPSRLGAVHELRQSQVRLAAIINASLDAIVCVDESRHITIFNPAAAAMFDCPAAQALGSPLERFLPDAALALACGADGERTKMGEMEGRTRAGRSLCVAVNLSVQQRRKSAIVTLFIRDLTARKRVETQRKVMEAKLRESQKMQAIGTMAGGIAHDFNNILAAILGNVALAKDDLGDHAVARTSLMEIEKAGHRARDLVRQILAFSRNDAPQRNPVDLADLVHETVRLLRVTLPPSIELKVQIAQQMPTVLADATQVERALLNLCTNAVHAIGASRGTITVKLDSTRSESLLQERRETARGDHVSLSVRDTGPGMDPPTRERIFEPFFTTKPVGQGTGLGLAVVHGVMQAHQGSVGVQSAPGQGSVFTLYFPLANGEPAAQHSASEPSVTPAGHGQHVMYVDDDEALVFLVQRALTRQGYRVSGFTDPHAALAALRAHPRDVDLLVSDYNMPGYCGIDLLREARRLQPGLRLAMASGYISPEIKQLAKDEGASALIHKPNDVEALCEIVQRLMQGRGAG